MEGYETVESDSDSGSTLSVVSAIFAVSRDSGGKAKRKEDSDDESDYGSCFLRETMREGWQGMAALCGKMTDAEEGRVVGFPLSVVSNVCRMEPIQVVRLCCGLGIIVLLLGWIRWRWRRVRCVHLPMITIS